jgi:hypothetical protein
MVTFFPVAAMAAAEASFVFWAISITQNEEWVSE